MTSPHGDRVTNDETLKTGTVLHNKDCSIQAIVLLPSAKDWESYSALLYGVENGLPLNYVRGIREIRIMRGSDWHVAEYTPGITTVAEPLRVTDKVPCSFESGSLNREDTCQCGCERTAYYCGCDICDGGCGSFSPIEYESCNDCLNVVQCTCICGCASDIHDGSLCSWCDDTRFCSNCESQHVDDWRGGDLCDSCAEDFERCNNCNTTLAKADHGTPAGICDLCGSCHSCCTCHPTPTIEEPAS